MWEAVSGGCGRARQHTARHVVGVGWLVGCVAIHVAILLYVGPRLRAGLFGVLGQDLRWCV